jgi:PAS domain S-box-containing protein
MDDAHPLTSPPTQQSELRILVVDDDDTDLRAVRRYLHRAYSSATLDEARSAADALNQIAARRYDCLLLDYYLPDAHDLSLVRRIQAAAPELPIIMFTGRGDEDMAVELMKAGVADYIPKASITTERLAAGVRYAVALAQAAVKRRHAEAELRASEERLRRSLDIETVGILFFDIEGAITDANDAFLRMAGLSREDIEAGRVRWDELTPPEWMPQSLEAIEEFKTTGRTTSHEKECSGKDGRRWWALFSATRVNERGGVEFVVDITPRKRAEQELRRAIDQAQAATLAKSRFLAAISHDMRQPLQLLVRAHEVLDRESLSERARRSLRGAVRGTEHIIQSVHGLDELSKLESGTVTPARRTFPIQELLSEVHEICAPEANARGLGFSVATCGEWVDSDPAMLRSILENLTGNAIKYTERGSVAVECLRRDDELLLEVRDTGVGIAREKLGDIFHEYTRLAPQMSEGLGLGLAIVARLADLLGHRLEVQSTRGAGSCFRLLLPMASRR